MFVFIKLYIHFIDPTVPIVVGVLAFCLLLILAGVTISIIVYISKKKGKGYSIFSKYNCVIFIIVNYSFHTSRS